MRDFSFPQRQASSHASFENIELAAANRRLTAVILGMTLLTGLIAYMSYLAGRNVMHSSYETSGPLVINPLAPEGPAAVLTGALYLQVGLLEPAVDLSMQERLVLLGYRVKLAPMENPSIARVLVGPVQSVAHQRQLEALLITDGYQSFPSRN